MKSTARIALAICVMLVILMCLLIQYPDLTTMKEADLQLRLWIVICTTLIIAACGDYE